MHEKSVQTLEFPKVLERVAHEASFSVGRARVLALTPRAELATAARWLACTSEAVRLLDQQPRTALGGAHDVRPQLVRAAREGDLTAAELLNVLSTLRSARSVAGILRDLDPDGFPQLSALGAELPVHPALIHRIEEVLNEDGEILDSASPRLRRLRADARLAGQHLQQRLRGLVGEFGHALQEPIVTMRGDRYVLPVKADFRGRVRGIVHDQSASGATLFIEPMAVVELNNRLRELQSQERDEVERILRELSREIGREAEAIERAVEGLGEFDFQLAKARYSRLHGGVEPRLNAEGRLQLRGARHPLLAGRVVPLDLELGGQFFMIVVTGPNTGGKTVALKTVGLLTLMAQAGLHLPAGEESEIAVFEEVFADIGDEQSIEQNLSTFSSHLTRIIDILRGVEAVRRRQAPGEAGAETRSLVLLDELGAGTDPDEGSALARSILTYLLDRRVPTVATTHYSELKAFAHEQRGAINASVAFDAQTLSPTYELEIGRPGRSNALAIAERLGLDPRIVRGARRHLGTVGVQMEGLLRDLEQERAGAETERYQLTLERAAAERERAEIDEARRRLEDERIRVLEAARAQARRELDEVLGELASIRAAARRPDLTRESLGGLRQRIRTLEDRSAPLAVPHRVRPSEDVERLEGPPRPGDTVRVRTFGRLGQLLDLSADGREAEVQMGPMRLRVGVDSLERVRARRERDAETTPAITVVRSEDRTPVPLQLDMRGRRVEEGLEELESYLNDAVMSGMNSVRILHGKGTGAMRAAVREYLARHPLVQSSEPAPQREGGDGVTIVRLSA